MDLPIDVSNYMPLPEQKVIRLQDHLPPEHYAVIETDPVVAFLHTVKTEQQKEVYLFPLVANSTAGGFIEGLPADQKIIGTTQAHPGGFMYSLYIYGPFIEQRITLGYSYPGQTQIDWEERAVKICDMLTEEARPLIEMIEQDRPVEEIEKAIRERETADRKRPNIGQIIKIIREEAARNGKK